MFKNILVPLDLTEKHKAALDNAAELAAQSGGQVVLFHVIEAIPLLTEPEEKDFYARLEGIAKAHLQKFAAPLLAQGIRCETMVVIGRRAPEMAVHARSLSADLIVLTAPTFETEHPFDSLGSLSWKIGLMAPCPVLLVK